MKGGINMPYIQIRTTELQQCQIDHYAQLLGMSRSEYGRMMMLHPDKGLSGKLAQEIATALCQHATLVNKLPVSTIRDDFEDWEKSIWQSIQ